MIGSEQRGVSYSGLNLLDTGMICFFNKLKLSSNNSVFEFWRILLWQRQAPNNIGVDSCETFM